MDAALVARADGRCELCGAHEALRAFAVGPHLTADEAHGVVICPTCGPQIAGEAALDPEHWRCLLAAAWSVVPAVQVVAWRLLGRLTEVSWARDLRDQLWLEDEIRAWAEAGEGAPEADAETERPTLDSQGTPLANGDTVSLIKSLDVKGAGFVAKRGTAVRNIRLTGDPEHIEGKVNGVSIYLKTCFLRKQSGA